MTNLTAKEILLSRGRGYLYKGKYPQVVVFTRAVLDVDKLEQEFGGHHYNHNTGYIWVLSNRYEQQRMLDVLGSTRSDHGFEDIVRLRRSHEGVQ